eukprot:Nitzschia sp. Nitz4//scaffold280_size24494//15652//17970//NITZ4_008394-RA/size24494-processed-gene-0.35-mRNA-1//-1//CDS//3329545597//9433//frame0
MGSESAAPGGDDTTKPVIKKKHAPKSGGTAATGVVKKKKKASLDDSNSTPTKPKSIKKKKKNPDGSGDNDTAKKSVKKKKPQSFKEESSTPSTPAPSAPAPAPAPSPAPARPPAPVIETPEEPISLVAPKPSAAIRPRDMDDSYSSFRRTGESNSLRGNRTLPSSGRGSGRGGPRPPNAGRGRGRGRAPASQRMLRPKQNGNPAKPRSMQSLQGLSEFDDDEPARPKSMHIPSSSSRNLGRGRGGPAAGRAARGAYGRSMKAMGRNAISNRNLPPPPGSTKRNPSSSRNLFGSRHGSFHKKPTSSRSSDTDDEDEFGGDLSGDELESEELNDVRPASILRTSTRGQGRRVSHDGSISLSLHSHFSIDEDEELNMSGEEFGEVGPMVSRLPSNHNPMVRPGLSRNPNNMDVSGHSMRGWTESFRWASGDRKTMMSNMSSSKSMRSVLTADLEFEEETRFVQWLRYLRIMAPHAHEKPIKRHIRICTWIALFLDFLTGIVSLSTYDGVTECCGKPILAIAGDFAWNKIIQITVYLYMIMIFAEILPVLREGFPFNLANPFVGFLITFAMFFDDRILEAVVMWIIEFCAIMCEVWIYRMKLKWHHHRGQRLSKTENDLKALRKERKRLRNGGERADEDSVSSDVSFGEKSFHDESNGESDTPPPPKDVSQIRETRLLRERRLLRQAQSEDRRHLRYHFTGVAFNIGLVVISMLMIVMIGRSGGLCVRNGSISNIFKSNPLEECSECDGADLSDGYCEACTGDGTDGLGHCYYPYY